MTSFVFIYVCLSMENEQPADLFSLTLLNWYASWSHRPFLNLLYLSDFLISPTQIDLVYRVYMLFQFNHEGPIIKTLSNDRRIYRIKHTIKYHKSAVARFARNNILVAQYRNLIRLNHLTVCE